MEKVKGVYLAKLTAIIAIIFTMLFSSFAPILSWAQGEGGEEQTVTENNDFVKFSLTWNSDGITEQNTKVANFDQETMAYYKLDFNTIQSGFKNIRVMFLGEDGATADYEGNIGNVDAGYSVVNPIKFTFTRKSDEDFSRTLKVILTGEYEYNGETVAIEIEKTITANLNAVDQSFAGEVKFPEYTNENVYNRQGYTSYVDINVRRKYYAIKLRSTTNRTQYTKITLQAVKTGSSEINNYPTQMTVSGLGDEYSIGSYNAETGTLEIERGSSEQEEYTSSGVYSQDITFYVEATYNISGEEAIFGVNGYGYYFDLDLTATTIMKGYSYHYGTDGETYSIITKNYTPHLFTSEFVKAGLDVGVMPFTLFGSNIEKEGDLSADQIQVIKEGRDLEISYISSMNLQCVDNESIGKFYVYNYNFTAEDANIEGITKSASTLNSEKSYVKYGTSNTKKYIVPELKSIQIQNLEKSVEGARILFYKRGDVEGVDEPFFIASEGHSSYTVPDGTTITEYYAVYDVSQMEANCLWEYMCPSSYWRTSWIYNKEIIDLTDSEIESITEIGKYQEGVEVGNPGTLNTTYYCRHTEDWSQANIAEGVSANTKVSFSNCQVEALPDGSVASDYIRIRKVTIKGALTGRVYKIFAKGANVQTDEPLYTINSSNNVWTPSENIYEFDIYEDINSEYLSTLYGKTYYVYVEYELIQEKISELGRIPSLYINVNGYSDAKQFNYDESTHTITGTTQGEIYENTRIATTRTGVVTKNYSTKYNAYYTVVPDNYSFYPFGQTDDVNVSSVGKVEDATITVWNYDLSSRNIKMRLKNPTYYIELSDDFEYDVDGNGYSFNVDDRNLKNVSGYPLYGLVLKDTRVLRKNINGKEKFFYVIEFSGETGRNWYNLSVKFDVNFKRKLKEAKTSSTPYILWMKDDYGSYYSSQYDTYDLDDDETTTKMAYYKINFSYLYNNEIKLATKIYDESGDVEVDNALIEPGKTATLKLSIIKGGSISANLQSYVIRLPFVGNKSILDGTTRIGEDGRETGAEFVVNSIEGGNVTAIGYSSNETASQESDFTFIERKSLNDYTTEELETIRAAKTLFIKRNVRLGNVTDLTYQLKIPNDAETGKLAGEQFLINYKVNNNNQQLEAPASYIEVGEYQKTTLTITKKFEGTTPTANKGGIEFRVTGLDVPNTYTATTNAEGIATVTGINPGTYEVSEITTFEDYDRDSSKIIKASKHGGSIELTFNNDIKTSTVKINKTWQNAKSLSASAKFKIEGTTVSGDAYRKEVYVSSSNPSVSSEVPYGTYTVKEIESTSGWWAENDEQEIVVNSQDVINVDFNNIIPTISMVINKTVPEGDTAEGLKFHIYGYGDAKYYDENDNLVQQYIDKVITIGADGKGRTDGIPMGTYTVEEIDMPVIQTDDGETTRYIPLKTYVTVSDPKSEKIVELDNKWKTGKLNVEVTATEGTELTEFSVKVSGTSYYGRDISEEYPVPSNGKILIDNLPIGRYKVEELNTRVDSTTGKIYTTNPDGFEVTYTPEDVNTNGVVVEYKKTTQAKIHNEFVGKGSLKIIKSMEGETDPSKAAGIEFKLKGKDYVGNSVEETITIGSNGIGTLDNIPVGTYLLSENPDTVPEEYEIADEREVTITTENTQDNPLEFSIENELARRDIIMDTELATGGYPGTPVTYTVTKVNEDLTPLEEGVDITGDRKSHAEKKNAVAGTYIVSQKTIPEGYIKDYPQVVKINRNESGYALFIIDRPSGDEFIGTKITVNKEVVNEQGFTATEQDYRDAKLKADGSYSFEIKLQNVATNQIYYMFVDNGGSKTIVGLPYGTYTVEELYKPKFKLVSIAGSQLTTDETTGKKTFTLSADSTPEQNNIVINVKNKIDKDFGFGGQDPMDNLSKVKVTEIENNSVTQSRIYVRSDEGNGVSDITFKLEDKDGNVIKLSGTNGVYIPSDNGEEVISPENGNITLKSLAVGTYKLVPQTVSDEYLLPDTKEVKVYENVVGVRRIELLRNIPRGTLRLSTVYKDELGNEKYAPKSSYKIINPQTDEKLTFIKKVDGTYERSNLPNATDTIELKAGNVDVTGIEKLADNESYYVGLTYVTDKYAIIDDTIGEQPDNAVQSVQIVENDTKNIKVNVQEKQGFVKVQVYNNGMVVLDDEGNIWVKPNSSSIYVFEYCMNEKITTSKVKFTDFALVNYAGNIIAIDENGKLWISGLGSTSVPTCLSDDESSVFHGVKMKQIAGVSCYKSGAYLLDENGKVWVYNMDTGGQITSNTSPDRVPWMSGNMCISDTTDLNNTKIVSLAEMGSPYNSHYMAAIDKDGKVWTWGYNYYGESGVPFDKNATRNYNDYGDVYVKPTCISNIEESNIHGKKIIQVTCGNSTTCMIDENNDVWVMGDDSNSLGDAGLSDSSTRDKWNPICITKDFQASPFYGVKIRHIACMYSTFAAIDTNGKIWMWGSENSSGAMAGASSTRTPVCISDIENNGIDTVKFKYVAGPHSNGSAIDEDGNLWAWGSYIPYGENAYSTFRPCKITMPKKAYVDVLPNFTKVAAGDEHALAIDREGRIWAWGSNSNGQLGVKMNSSIGSGATNILQLVGEYNTEITNTKFVDISASYGHNLALDENGNLWSWGYNYYQACGVKTYDSYMRNPKCISTMNPSTVPSCYTFDNNENVLYGKKIKVISAGGYCSSAVIDENGKIYTFGYNSNGTLGNGTSSSNSAKCLNDTIDGLENVKFKDVSVGSEFMCAIDENDKLWVWGSNSNGKIGIDTSTSNKLEPYCLSDDQNSNLHNIKIKKIECGNEHTLAIDEHGKLWSWGDNVSKQLGNGTYEDSYNAICLSDIVGNTLYGKKITTVEAGSYMSLAIDEEGKIYTWGSNSYNLLGQGDETSTSSSYDIKCINNDIKLIAKQVSIANYNSDQFAIAVDANDEIWMWSTSTKTVVVAKNSRPLKLQGSTERLNSQYGQINTSIAQSSAVSVNNAKITRITDVLNVKQKMENMAEGVTLVLDNDGNLWSYGKNGGYGLLGDGTYDSRYEPITINDKFDNKKISEILYLSDIAIVVDEDGYIWTWGNNQYGQVGIGTINETTVPTPHNTGIKYKSLEVANNTIYAKDENDYLYMWGYNRYGECGTGNNQICPTVTKVINNPVSEILSKNPMMVKDSSGNLWMWGSNFNAQCANGTTDDYATPNCINTSAGFELKEIVYAEPNSYYMVLDTNDKLWTWGRNSYGGCGNGSTNKVTAPYNISDIVVDRVVSKKDTVAVVDTNSKLWIWGKNSECQCAPGTDSTTTVTTPNCISSLTVDEVIVDQYGSTYSAKTTVYVIDTAHKLWVWGDNSYNQTGAGSSVSRVYTPRNISGITANKIILTGSMVIVQDNNGYVWGWGWNSYNILGSTNGKVQPVRIFSSRSREVIPLVQYSSSGYTIYNLAIIDEAGAMYVRGYNRFGVCGNGQSGNSASNIYSPSAITGLNVAKVVLATYGKIIVQDVNGKIWSWGSDTNGDLGMGSNETTNTVTGTPAIRNTDSSIMIKDIIYTQNTIIVRDEDDKIWTWGENTYGQCGTGTEGNFATPKCINDATGLENVKFEEISVASNVVTAKDSDGKTWLWGENTQGSLGVGKAEDRVLTPVCVEDYRTQIGLTIDSSTSDNGTYFIFDTNGELWTYGANRYGQCGTGTDSTVGGPTCITNEMEAKIVKLLNTYETIIAKDENGKLWSWGLNENGECGVGTTDQVLVPTMINVPFEDSDRYDFSGEYKYIIKENGTAYVWGNGITSPTKINDLDKLNGADVKEIAIESVSPTRLMVLSEDGYIYAISNNLTVECLSEQDIVGYYNVEGPWKYTFRTILNTKR